MTTPLDIAKQALNDILDPIGHMERNLPEGYRLDGHAALQQMNSREFYIRIAREALAAIEAAVPVRQRCQRIGCMAPEITCAVGQATHAECPHFVTLPEPPIPGTDP
jgi:hypothetical protein